LSKDGSTSSRHRPSNSANANYFHRAARVT
jgi:hypothetical protein